MLGPSRETTCWILFDFKPVRGELTVLRSHSHASVSGIPGGLVAVQVRRFPVALVPPQMRVYLLRLHVLDTAGLRMRILKRIVNGLTTDAARRAVLAALRLDPDQRVLRTTSGPWRIVDTGCRHVTPPPQTGETNYSG